MDFANFLGVAYDIYAAEIRRTSTFAPIWIYVWLFWGTAFVRADKIETSVALCSVGGDPGCAPRQELSSVRQTKVIRPHDDPWND